MAKNTAVPSAPAPELLAAAIKDYEEVLTARDKMAEPMRKLREELTEQLADIEDRFDHAYEVEIKDLAEAESELAVRLGTLKAEAVNARAETDNAVFDHAGWTVTTKQPTASLVVHDLIWLANEIERRFPGELEDVLPRKVATAELKRLVNYAIAAERPLTHADVTAEGKDMIVVVRPPDAKPEKSDARTDTEAAMALQSIGSEITDGI